jgi:hypothetical protein
MLISKIPVPVIWNTSVDEYHPIGSFLEDKHLEGWALYNVRRLAGRLVSPIILFSRLISRHIFCGHGRISFISGSSRAKQNTIFYEGIIHTALRRQLGRYSSNEKKCSRETDDCIGVLLAGNMTAFCQNSTNNELLPTVCILFFFQSEKFPCEQYQNPPWFIRFRNGD